MEPITNLELSLLETMRLHLEDLGLPNQYLEYRYLVCFLRARDHSLPKAEEMVLSCFKWRKEFHIDTILEWSYPQKFKYFWPFYLTGFDKWGGPLIVNHLGRWDTSKVGRDYDAFVKFMNCGVENTWKLITKRSEGQPTFNQVTYIIDLDHLGVQSLTTTEALSGVLSAIRTVDANYPELLRIGIVVNAPYIFDMGWKLVKPLLSDRTRSKVKLLGYNKSSWTEELLKYADASQFPCKYGGTFPDDCGMTYANGTVNGRFYRSKGESLSVKK